MAPSKPENVSAQRSPSASSSNAEDTLKGDKIASGRRPWGGFATRCGVPACAVKASHTRAPLFSRRGGSTGAPRRAVHAASGQSTAGGRSFHYSYRRQLQDAWPVALTLLVVLLARDADAEAIKTALSAAKLEVGEFDHAKYALSPTGQLIALTGDVTELITTGERSFCCLARLTPALRQRFDRDLAAPCLLLAAQPPARASRTAAAKSGTATTGCPSRARAGSPTCTAWSGR